MESSLTLNKGVHEDKFCKKALKEFIQILYTNADGLSNTIDELNTRINETFSEIIAICEIKLNDDIGNEVMPKNYMIIRKDRSWSRGGVCIMVHEDLNSKVFTDLNCVDAGNTDHLWCEISTKDGMNMIVIGLIYRPPNNNHEDDSKLNSLLIVAEQCTIKKQLLVLGDFQIYDGI